jgi:DNA oxidative demethylase
MKRSKGIIEIKPEGLVFKSEFLTEEEERGIVSEIERLPFQPFKMQGWVAKREVIHFGYDYHYDVRRIKPTIAIPQFLKPYLERAADCAGLNPSSLEEVLVTKYSPGAGIGWHKDAPVFGSPVIGISIGSSCIMKFRRRKISVSPPSYEVYSLVLTPRSLYILDSEARSHWEHHIPPAKQQQLRYSITFRVLRDSQRRS